jgi:hypothetical protein
LARVSYGVGDADPEDFIAHWFAERGYPFLGLSYPSGHSVFSHPHPEFSVKDWAAQVAEATDQAVAELSLDRRTVIVLAWSMAGRLVYRLRRALLQHRIELALFVSLEAAHELTFDTVALERYLPPDANGLVDLGPLTPSFVASVQEQRQLADRLLIPDATFVEDYLAPFPVNLTATRLRCHDAAFTPDLPTDREDVGCDDLTLLPPISALSGRSQSSLHHALTDQAAWGDLATQSAMRNFVLPLPDGGLPQHRWQSLLTLVRGVPAATTGDLEGGHLFFLGRDNARQLVSSVEQFVGHWRRIREEVSRTGQEKASNTGY